MGTPVRDGYGHDTTTDEVLEGIDLSGKLALVTGASSGIGAETARALASKGAQVVITARDIPKGETVAEGIKASTGNDAVEVESLELASMADVRAFAERFLSKHDALNILVNNAGVMACPYATTQDGLEMQFGTNHIGHFLMTCLLAPALIKGAPSRVVSLSSRGHFMSPVVLDDIQFENREYQKWPAYGQSKTANILFAVGLEKRLGDKGVHANAVHPGVIQTELARHLTEEDFAMFQARAESGAMKMKTTEAGAATSVLTATAPELEGRGGLYLEDCSIADEDDASENEGVRSYAVDADNADKLWAASEAIVGESFSF